MRKAITFFTSLLLAAVLSASAVLCPLSSFKLPGDSTFIVLICLLMGIYFTAGAMIRKLPVALAVTFAPMALLIFGSIRQSLTASAFAVIYDITDILANFYQFAVAPAEFAGTLAGDDATAFLLLAAAIPSALTAWTVVRQITYTPVFAVSLLYLAPCLFIVETVPSLAPLLTLTACICLLILTDAQRRRGAYQGAVLTLYLAAPMAALVLLLAFFFPQAEYVRPQWPDDLRESLNYRVDSLAAKFQGKTPKEPLFANLIASEGETTELYSVDLSRLGPRKTTGSRVMQVKGDKSGFLYLRGTSFATYSANTWQAADPQDYPETDIRPLVEAAGEADGVISLRTASPQDIIFTPYYLSAIPEGGLESGDMYVANDGGLREYDAEYSTNFRDGKITAGHYEDYVYTQYTYVPEQLRVALLNIMLDNSLLDTPESLTAYVKSAAVYDLDTEVVPEDEDFVLWFLTQSHQGYCVHFATSVCMMLRTIGIPARYVTGYLATAKEGQWAAVTDRDAHAWVEYYVQGVGWVPLECTPSTADEPIVPEPTSNDISTDEPTPDKTQAPASTPDVSASASPVSPQAPEEKSLSGAWWLLLIPTFAAGLAAYRYTLLHFKKQRWRAAKPNKRAVILWREIIRASKALKREPSADMEDAAMKARFSPHTMTAEELQIMSDFLHGLHRELKGKNLFFQVYYRCILVLY